MKYIQPMAGIVSRFAPESISKRYEERAAKMRRFYFDGDTMRRTRDSNSEDDSFFLFKTVASWVQPCATRPA